MRLYSYPLNYHNNRTSPVECADNDYNTFTTSTSIVCNIDSKGDGTGDARDITDVFIKGKGINTVAFTVDGNAISHTVQDRVTNDSNEQTSIIDFEGYQNILIQILHSATKPKDDTITFTFTARSGETLQIAEVLCLDEILVVGEPTQAQRLTPTFGIVRPYDIDWIDLGDTRPSATGRMNYISALNNERDKWAARFEILGALHSGNEDHRAVIQHIENFVMNYKRFTCAVEYNRYPRMVSPCVFPERETQLRWLGRSKKTGRTALFRVREI